jgi:S1-C subfamily serine protease
VNEVRRARATWTLLAIGIMAIVVAVPALTRAGGRKEIIKSTMPAVTMIMAVDVKEGKLIPVSSGSGTIIDSNGSVITNYHVLFDAKNNKLHDLFVIGLFRSADQEPELVCAGNPAKGVLKPDLDLALIRCDRDRAGDPWLPKGWPTIPVRKIDTDDIVPGEQVWVLGYPGVGGGTIHVTAGLVSGWTGENGGASSRAFMKTDASISHGNSGGTAIDEDGNFIGVPTAFRFTTTTQGDAVVTSGRVGLIRPLDHALDLIAVARKGGPSQRNTAAPATAAPADGVRITSKVVDASDGNPIEGATIVVFKAGLKVKDLKEDALEDQALSWAQTDGAGVFRMEQALPRGGAHTVAVVADGYLSLVESDVLSIPLNAPPELDPWNRILLQRE